MGTSLTLTVGKCVQLALLVTPLIILIAWGMGINLALSFGIFELTALFTSVFTLNTAVGLGHVTW